MKAYCKGVLILIILLGLALTACQRKTPQENGQEAAQQQAETAGGETKTITDHAGNTVEIPIEPKRIASLHTMSATTMLWELGAPLVGTATRKNKNENNRPYIRGLEEAFSVKFQDTGLADYGLFGEDLEAVKASKPDLIVGIIKTNAKKYDKFAAIAPTVLIDNQSADLLSVYKDLAKWVGKDGDFDQKEAAYKERLENVRAKFSTAPGSQTVAYAMPRPGKAQYLARIHWGAFTYVAYDLGFKPLPYMVQQFEADSSGGYISSETFGQYNPDFLLSTYSRSRGETSDYTYDSFDDIAPGWREYNTAYQNNQIILLNREDAYPTVFKVLNWLLEQFEKFAK